MQSTSIDLDSHSIQRISKYENVMVAKKNWHFNKKEQHRRKREVLLKVAAECFNSQGISGTCLKDVAKKLGITDAALYYYVKNKEELVNLCYVRALDLGELALDKAVKEGSDCLDKLGLYIRYQIAEVCGVDGPVAILSEIPSLKAEHQKYVLDRSTKHTKRITKLLKEGIKEGSMATDDPAITSDAILGALNWLPKWYRADAGISGEQIADSFIQTFTMGLKTR